MQTDDATAFPIGDHVSVADNLNANAPYTDPRSRSRKNGLRKDAPSGVGVSLRSVVDREPIDDVAPVEDAQPEPPEIGRDPVAGLPEPRVVATDHPLEPFGRIGSTARHHVDPQTPS